MTSPVRPRLQHDDGILEESAVRPVIVSNIVSLDGFYEGPEQNVMALNMDAAFDAYNLERIRSAGTMLLGRSSFVGFSSYWSRVADAPADPGNRALSDTNREISRTYSRIPKVVVSDSFVIPHDNPWGQTSRVVSRRDVASWLGRERRHGAGDILTFGSRITWNGLLAEGLIDEVHLMVGPEVLGQGTPAFHAPVRLSLAGVREFEGSDNVVLRYRPLHVNSG